MSEPLHLKPDEPERLEQIRLGDQTLELDPTTASTVRNAFESLAAQYGAALEEFRRQSLQNVGTNYVPPQPYAPQEAPGLGVPDPDLLFSNKDAWTQEFQNALEQKIGGVRGEAAQLVQQAVGAFQQELQMRDLRAASQAKHDAAMEEMLERRGLSDHTRIVQAIYNEQYDKLKHLPLELGLDKIGQLAQEEIERIRSGEQWTMTSANTQTGVTQRPPAVLRSARRAAAPAPSPAAAPPGGESPYGSLSPMGLIIRKRQAALLGRGAA